MSNDELQKVRACEISNPHGRAISLHLVHGLDDRMRGAASTDHAAHATQGSHGRTGTAARID